MLSLLKNVATLFKECVDRLDGTAIEGLYANLLDNNLSSTIVHHVHHLLRAAFHWAKSKKVALITRDPFEWDEIETPRRSKSEAQSLMIGQAQAALESVLHTKHPICSPGQRVCFQTNERCSE